ncbi:hypothetical protein HOY80DRAFT_1039302 [Tuber brumale]|nr:hypothetical protein HOY80DRAFT_1039302 [Tuber brumale]
MTSLPTIRPRILSSNATTTEPASLIKGWGFTGSDFGWGACLSEYNDFLDGSTEIDKWASGVATTLMTMLPSMIAFSPLKTADTQTLCYLDAFVALVTCGFTLLFRVETWVTLPKDKIWRVTDILDKVDINAIYYRTRCSSKDYPSLDPDDISITRPRSPTPDATSTGTGTEVIPDQSGLSPFLAANIDIPRLKRLYEGGRLKKLQQDALGTSTYPIEIESGSMTTASMQTQQNEGYKKPRPYRITVYMVITIFCLIQLFLYFVISSWVFKTDSTFFIWSCAEAGIGIFCWWIVGSFLLASAVRYAPTSMWMRPDEIFHIERLTIIEYETERERVAIWFVLNSMPDCFIESKNSSYRYANGYRPHLCTETGRNPGTAAVANLGRRDLESIPMPDTDMLKTTTTQVHDVKTICTFCSVALGLALALSVGVVAGTIRSYSLYSKFTTNNLRAQLVMVKHCNGRKVPIKLDEIYNILV